MFIFLPFIMVEKRVDIMVVYVTTNMRYQFLCSIWKVSWWHFWGALARLSYGIGLVDWFACNLCESWARHKDCSPQKGVSFRIHGLYHFWDETLKQGLAPAPPLGGCQVSGATRQTQLFKQSGVRCPVSPQTPDIDLILVGYWVRVGLMPITL
jgi:hypothetical protein